jgi:hypothetical protein
VYKWSINPFTNPNLVYSHTLKRDNILSNSKKSHDSRVCTCARIRRFNFNADLKKTYLSVWAISVERFASIHRIRFLGHAICNNDLCLRVKKNKKKLNSVACSPQEGNSEKWTLTIGIFLRNFHWDLNKTGLASYGISINKRIKGTFKMFHLLENRLTDLEQILCWRPYRHLCRIWGFHGGDYEGYRLLGCGAV